VSQATSHRFLIVRLGSMGDVIHGIPVVAALRERFPMARIDWMVDPRYVGLLMLVRGLDSPIPVDTRRPVSLVSTLRMLREVSYTAAIDLQGLVKSAALARASGAWHTIGFPRDHLREPMAGAFYTESPDPGASPHVVRKNLALLAPLGIRSMEPSFPIAVPPPAADPDASVPYALINPGAAWPNKRWPPERFGAVAAALRRDAGLRSVVLWGPGERAEASKVVDASEGAAVLAAATGITDLFALSSRARLMIAGDTGPLHVAAAVGTPVVAVFGPTRVERNGPWSPSDVTVARTDRCSCLYRRRCRLGAPCILDIGVDEVIAAVRLRLGRG
jgi:lipopolysaccharide heptosyltransferase I